MLDYLGGPDILTRVLERGVRKIIVKERRRKDRSRGQRKEVCWKRGKRPVVCC